ncbi:MAG: hypothetical protein AAF514_10295 [Verrucomicrobiota bacterium]
MKYLGSFLLTLLVLAGCLVIGGLLRKDPVVLPAGKDVRSIAGLLPSDTYLLVHTPDVVGAASAWGESDLGLFVAGEEIDRFLSRPLRRLSEKVRAGADWALVKKLKPEDFFVALQPSPEGERHFLAGFRSGEASASIDQHLAPYREEIQNRYGDITTANAAYEGALVRTHQKEDAEVVEAFVDGWYFVSNKRVLLTRVVEQLVSGTRPATSLENESDFVAVVDDLPGGYHALGFLRPERGLEAVAGEEDSGRKGEGATGAPSHPFADLRALGYVTTTAKGDFRDTATGLVTAGPAWEVPFERRTMRFTTPATYFYQASSLPWLGTGDDQAANRWWASIGEQLESENWPSLASLLGPEWAAMAGPLEGPSGRGSYFGIVLELEDPEIVESLLQRLSSRLEAWRAAGTGEYVVDTDRAGLAISRYSGILYLRMDEDFLIIATQPFSEWKRDGNQTLEDLPRFHDWDRGLPLGDRGIGYVDGRRVFDRIRETLGHPLIMASIWMSLKSQASFELDFDELPSPENWGDFRPTVWTINRSPGGIRLGASGTVSPVHWGAGLGASWATLSRTLFHPDLGETGSGWEELSPLSVGD